MLAVVLLAAGGVAAGLPALIVLALVGLALLTLLMRLGSRRRRVRVRLTSDQFIVSGDGYDARVMAPFRFKTGVERKPAS